MFYQSTIYTVEVEITIAYTYLGVQFSGPKFRLRKDLQHQINIGYVSLALLKCQCFKATSKTSRATLISWTTFIKPTILYG